MMRKKKQKGLHLKQNTEGTSNEISFSVLDAKKALGSQDEMPLSGAGTGRVRLFTLGRRHKLTSTPTKDKEILVGSDGESMPQGDGGTAHSATKGGSPIGGAGPGRAGFGMGMPGGSGRHGSDNTPSGSGRSFGQDQLSRSITGSSFAGVPGASGTPVDEVMKKKDHRRRRRIMTVSLVVIVLLVAGAGVGGVVMNYLEEHQSLQQRLVSQINRINEADGTLIPFDELVLQQTDESPLTGTASNRDTPDGQENDAAEGGYAAAESTGGSGSGTAAEADSARQQEEALRVDELEDYRPTLDEARSTLEDAMASIEHLQGSLTANEDKEAAHQALAAANARLTMMDSGMKILEEAQAALAAGTSASQGWDYILSADASVRQATRLMKDLSLKNAQAAKDVTEESLEDLEAASTAFAEAKDTYEPASLAPYSDYVQARIKAQKKALESEQAYIDRDKKAYATTTSEYNALESKAADLAGAFDGDPLPSMEASYKAAIADDVSSYNAARQQAGSADSFMRDYLSTVQG